MADTWIDVPQDKWIDIAEARPGAEDTVVGMRTDPASMAARRIQETESQQALTRGLLGGMGVGPAVKAGTGILRTIAGTTFGKAVLGGLAGAAEKTPIVGPMGQGFIAGAKEAIAPEPFVSNPIPQRGFIRSTPPTRGPSAYPGGGRWTAPAPPETAPTAQALNRRLVLSPAEQAREAQLAQLAEAQTQLERPAARLAGMRNAGR